MTHPLPGGVPAADSEYLGSYDLGGIDLAPAPRLPVPAQAHFVRMRAAPRGRV